MFAAEIKAAIDNTKTRSAWDTGVKAYALELLEQLPYNVDYSAAGIERDMLNGADNWEHYSWSGCALCYNRDIAFRLCNSTELKKTDGGCKQPNSKEEWLDVQARALYQACRMIINVID